MLLNLDEMFGEFAEARKNGFIVVKEKKDCGKK